MAQSLRVLATLGDGLTSVPRGRQFSITRTPVPRSHRGQFTATRDSSSQEPDLSSGL